jgi:hypothetical protein
MKDTGFFLLVRKVSRLAGAYTTPTRDFSHFAIGR